MQTSDRLATARFSQSLRPTLSTGPVMSFSPIHNDRSHAAKGAVYPSSANDANPFLSMDSVQNGNLENISPQSTDEENKPPSLMRAPHPANKLLHGMLGEVNVARMWLKNVSAGGVGSQAPYFSPCRAKGQVTQNIKEHPLYKELIADTTDYNSILNMKVDAKQSEPAKQAIQQRTMILKLRQAAHELLRKRELVVEHACNMDDEFTDREKAYKEQVSALSEQLRGFKSTAESSKSAAQGTLSSLQAMTNERDSMKQQLDQAAAQIREDAAAKVQALEQQLEETSKLLEDKEHLLSDLRLQLDANVEDLTSACIKVERLQTNANEGIAAKQKELDDTVQLLSQLTTERQAERADLEKKINILTAQNNSGMQSQDAALSELKANIESLKNEKFELVTSNADYLQQICRLNEKVYSLKEDNATLHKVAEEVKQDCKNTVENIKSSLMDELDSLEQKDQDMMQKERVLEEVRLQLEQTIADLRSLIAQKDGIIEILRQENSESSTAKRSLETSMSKGQEDLQALQSQFNARALELADVTQQCDLLKSQLQETSNRLMSMENVQAEFEEYKSAAEEKTAELQTQLQRLNDEVSRLLTAAEVSMQENSDLQVFQEQAEKRVAEQVAEMEQLKLVLKETTHATQASIDRITFCEKKVEELQEEVCRLEAEADQSRSECVELQQLKDEAQKDSATHLEEIERLKCLLTEAIELKESLTQQEQTTAALLKEQLLEHQEREAEEKAALEATISTVQADLSAVKAELQRSQETQHSENEATEVQIASVKAELQQSRDTFASEKQEMEAHVALLTSELQNSQDLFRSEKEEMQAQVSSLTTELKESKDSFDSEKEEMEGRISSLTLELEQAVLQLEQADSEKEAMKTQIASLTAELLQSTDALRSEKEDMETQIALKSAIFGTAQERIVQIESELSAAKAELESKSSVIDALLENISCLEKDAESLEAERLKLSGMLAEESGRKSSVEEKLDSVQKQLYEANQHLTDAAAALHRRDTEIDRKEVEVIAQEGEIHKLKKRVNEAALAMALQDEATQKTVNKMKEQMDKDATTIQSRNEDVERLNESINKLTNELAEGRLQLETLVPDLETTKAEKYAKSLEVQALKADVEKAISSKVETDKECERIVSKMKEELASVHAQHEREASDRKSLQERVERMEDKLGNARTELAVKTSQLESLTSNMDRSATDRDEARAESARLMAERDMLNAKVSDMQQRLDDKELQVRDAMRTVSQAQEMQIGRTKELQDVRDGLENDLARSKEEAKQTKYELDKLKSVHSEAEKMLQQVTMQVQTANLELESVKAQLMDAETRLDVEHGHKTNAEEKLAVLEAEYRTYKTVCSTPTNQLADQLKQMVAVEADKASAKSRVQAAEEETDNHKATIANLRDEVKILRQKLVVSESARRKLHNELQELKGNIRVFTRTRPSDERCAVDVDDEVGQISVVYKGHVNAFQFDRTFNQRATQEDMFAEVSAFVQSALDGFNVSLFAYGQTGSGKTYTMFGTPSGPGIIPRSIDQILTTIEQQAENGWTYEMEASFLEIYQEHVRDLLCSVSEREGKEYKIVAGENGRNDVQDLVTYPIHSHADVEKVTGIAEGNRTIAKTDMNEHSSRRITATKKTINNTQVLHGTLHLVDLAGSERLAKSHATGDRLNETKSINKSLSALSDVFVAISKKQAHVPYRNSKLTFLLQPCLSGDGKALVIANMSPTEDSAHESLCTLRFASMVSTCELGKANKHVSTTSSAKEVVSSPLDVPNTSVESIGSTASETQPTKPPTTRQSSRQSIVPSNTSNTKRSTMSGSARPTSASAARKGSAPGTTGRPSLAGSKQSSIQQYMTPAKTTDDDPQNVGKVYGQLTPNGTLTAPPS